MAEPAPMLPALQASLDRVRAHEEKRHSAEIIQLPLWAEQKRGTPNYRVLLTKVPPPPENDGPQLRAHLDEMGIPIFKAEIPRLKAFDKAYYAGSPVYKVDDPHAERAWQAYNAVGKEISNG